MDILRQIKSISFSTVYCVFSLSRELQLENMYFTTKTYLCVCLKLSSVQLTAYLKSLPITHYRTMWKKCSFSGDGEFIVAGSAKQHSLYIWEKAVGNLVKILHGTKGELLLDVSVSVIYMFNTLNQYQQQYIFYFLFFYMFNVMFILPTAKTFDIPLVVSFCITVASPCKNLQIHKPWSRRFQLVTIHIVL